MTIEARNLKNRGPQGTKSKPEHPPPGFDPLAMAGDKAARYAKLGAEAHRSYRAAVKAKCLDCCCWDYNEAKRCEIVSCPLWAVNRRIFARSSSRKPKAAPESSQPSVGRDC